MIKSNIHKYSVPAMCKILHLPRSTYYYEAKQWENEDILEMTIIKISKESDSNYGTRQNKVELTKRDIRYLDEELVAL